MSTHPSIRPAQREDLPGVRDLTLAVFTEFVAPLYPEQGRQAFDDYCELEAFEKRFDDDHFVMLAEDGGRTVGVLEMRRCGHISLFYVAPAHQGKGLGTRLLREAVSHCIRQGESPQVLTVHSSPNAVSAYAHMGFAKSGEENTVDGIRFLPMSVQVSKLMPRR